MSDIDHMYRQESEPILLVQIIYQLSYEALFETGQERVHYTRGDMKRVRSVYDIDHMECTLDTEQK